MENLNFIQAMIYLVSGKKISRTTWLDDDFLCIKDEKYLVCDGGFDYLNYLTLTDIQANDWKVYNEAN